MKRGGDMWCYNEVMEVKTMIAYKKMNGEKVMLSGNQMTILTELKKNGWMFRKDLVKKLGLPRTTIYDNLKILLNYGLVEKIVRPDPKDSRGRGRPKTYWRLIKK